MAAQTRRAPASDSFDRALVVLAGVALVACTLLFSRLVTRVFDVPKALALKACGGSLALLWIGRAVYGNQGVRWGQLRAMGPPLVAVVAVAAVSTALSIDPKVSLFGVYERQFGFQGLFACTALFAVLATVVPGRASSLRFLSLLPWLGALMSTYALLQSQGHDPYRFYLGGSEARLSKVHSFLGNPNFSGNALALLFPFSLFYALSLTSRWRDALRLKAQSAPRLWAFWGVGAVAIIAIQWLPAQLAPTAGTAGQRWMFVSGAVGSAAFLWILFDGWDEDSAARGFRFSALLSGAVFGLALWMIVGLITTRTRGAWVGASAGLGAGLLASPWVVADSARAFRRWRLGATLAVVLGTVALTAFTLLSDHLYAKTIRSIPIAFTTTKANIGRGQGTRHLLWSESPRVLSAHDQTLDRIDLDRQAYAQLSEDALSEAGLPAPEAAYGSVERFFRTKLVWLFGIGVETYRYAFMSHKGRLLETRDPMTNHDNPHNNYLYVLASFGVLGLVAYLWMLVSAVRLALRFLRRREAPLGYALSDDELRTEFGDEEIACRREKGRTTLSLRVPEGSLQLDELPEGAIIEGDDVSIPVPSGQSPQQLIETLRVPIRLRQSRWVALGLLASMVAYAVYSIAGFDTIASSAMLYCLFGVLSVFFFRASAPRRALASEERSGPRGWSIHAGAAACGLVALATIWGGTTVYRAERAFVGRLSDSGVRQRPTVQERISDMKQAIRINPAESYYRLQLANLYSRLSRRYGQALASASRQSNDAKAARLRKASEKFAKSALFWFDAALRNAWAPENIMISKFQFHLSRGEARAAEEALELALTHSPHLPPVRANLAALQLKRRALTAAIENCEWVIDVKADSALGHRVCGRAYQLKGALDRARTHLSAAKKYAPKDQLVDTYLAELPRPSETSSAPL